MTTVNESRKGWAVHKVFLSDSHKYELRQVNRRTVGQNTSLNRSQTKPLKKIYNRINNISYVSSSVYLFSVPHTIPSSPSLEGTGEAHARTVGCPRPYQTSRIGVGALGG